jgi:hypothetical protein
LTEIPNVLHLQRLWYWIRAAGVPLLLGLPGVWMSLRLWRRGPEQDRRREFGLFVLLAVSGFYFGVINFYRFSPNWGDSNKFFLYLDLVLCLYAGRLLSLFWKKSLGLGIFACVLVSLGSVIPSAIEWTERYGRVPEYLFRAGDRLVAEWIRINTPKDAVFLTANTTVHLVPALAGRRAVNGAYTRATGYADGEIEQLVAKAYRESDASLIKNVLVTHIFAGPEEDGLYHVDRAALGRRYKMIYDQSCRGVRYSIYDTTEPGTGETPPEQAYGDPRSYVWLSALEPSFAQQTFSTLKFDQSVDQTPLILNGRTYAFGLGTHADSEIRFNLGGAYSFFESDIGLDDNQIGGIGCVTFAVWVDDKKVYESRVMHAGDKAESVKVDVSGASTLKLVVAAAADNNHCDHADWAAARVLLKK